jgi:thioredoxin-related protein
MFSRRRVMVSALASAAALSLVSRGARPAHGAEIGDDGLHKQDWFLDSFLDLGDDHAETTAEGKHLAVLFEQRGCPYCRELHEVNLDNPAIRDAIVPKFNILQLDLWGSRAVTDFDGTEMEERKLGRAWQVNFTPTIVFFPRDVDLVAGKSGRDAEIARMPGYFKPFHFVSMFEFVDTEAYKVQSFQRFLQDKFAKLEAEGKKPEVW